jgi:glyoxylase-like metal-dependent hydrolase (beta-lactamase superfamily II)
MNHFQPLFPGVYLLQGVVGGRPLRLPLLAGAQRTLLLDTGCAPDVEGFILPALRELDLEPGRLNFIINTHCDLDHTGGNHGLKQHAPQALLCCGAADQEQIEDPQAMIALRYDAYRADHGISYEGAARDWIIASLGQAQPVDLTLRGGERLRLAPDWEVEILHLPGHSRGHLGVLDRKHRALYAGDAIHGAQIPDLEGQPALGPTYLHVDQYLDTIRFIENLDIDCYVGCHWPVKGGDEIAAFCAESRAYVEQAERLILEALALPRTLRELCFTLGPRLGPWPEAFNSEHCYAFGGHLRRLLNQDRIADQGGLPRRYQTRA